MYGMLELQTGPIIPMVGQLRKSNHVLQRQRNTLGASPVRVACPMAHCRIRARTSPTTQPAASSLSAFLRLRWLC